MKLGSRCFSFFLLVLLLLTFFVSADGGFIPPNNYQKDISEPNQNSIIVFNEETEKMILQVSYESEIEKFAWVIPVPTYPSVNKSSSILFNQISTLTKPIHHSSPNIFPVFSRGIDLSDETSKLFGGTSLHERFWMDVFTIEVVSSTSSSSLYDWLVEHDYSVSPKIQSALDPYIEDGWYFVIMKFNADYRVYELISQMKKMNSSVISVLDAKPVLADYVISSVKEGRDYRNTKLSTITYTSIGQNYNSYDYYRYNVENNPQVPFVSESKYREYSNLIYDESYLREKIMADLDLALEWDSDVNPDSKNKGVLNPLQIEFSTDEIIYPLKVSSMNSGVSEILLYVLAPYKTEIEGFLQFELEYAKRVRPNDIQNYDELNKLFDQRYFITKYRGSLFPEEMSSDLIFSEAKDEREFVLHTYEEGYIFSWIVIVVVLFFVYLISVVVCLLFRWLNNLIIGKNQNSKMYIPIRRVFLQGVLLPVFTFISYFLLCLIIDGIFNPLYRWPDILVLGLFILGLVVSLVLAFIVTHAVTFVIVLAFVSFISPFRKV